MLPKTLYDVIALQNVEDAIEQVYLEAYKPYREGRIRDLPRLDPRVGVLGTLWQEFDRLVEGGTE